MVEKSENILVKYQKTFHLPWSLGVQSDDKVLKNIDFFYNKEVVVLEKLDGENSSLYSDYLHARSLDSRHNFTRDWLKKMHSILRFDIPKNYQFCGENLWGEHSIRYPDGYLSGYFYLFAIWDNLNDFSLNYDDVLEFAELLDLPTPKILYRGIWDENLLKSIADKMDTNLMEGYVVRTVEGFKRSHFKNHVAKFVRANHVQTDAVHWLKNVKQNGELKETVKPFYMK